jgi:uncharacterized membrane protein (DUF2068 family)
MSPDDRPFGVAVVSGLAALSTVPSTATALALAFPGAWADAMWRLKPDARADFARLGPWAIALMVVVAAGCAATALGLWHRRRWGHRLAVLGISVNLLGDTTNAVVRGDWRTLIGLPIGGAVLAYLLSHRVREWFGKA